MNFSRQKNGYNENEVDKYLDDLFLQHKIEMSKKEAKIAELQSKVNGLSSALQVYKEKKETISSALISAVEKAKQIEESSKNVYKLKIQQLNILYKKWEFLLAEMLEKYPELSETIMLNDTVQNFQDSIKQVLANDFQFTSTVEVEPKHDPIRVLLEKINQKNSKTQNIEKKQPVTIKRSTASSAKTPKKSILISSSNESVEDFLDGPSANKNALKLGEDSGMSNDFDLSEALTPKDNLDEIMKAFDFFNEKK